MNQFVLLGTTTDVPTGTQSSCYRGPESDETSWHSTTCRGRNFTNLESFGFLLTRSRPVGKRAFFVNSHQRARTGHRCSKDGSRPGNWTAAELGADRASQRFSTPKGSLQPAELGARRSLSVLRFSRANSSSIASGLRHRSKIASFGRGICVAIGHGDLFTIEILHDDGGAA